MERRISPRKVSHSPYPVVFLIEGYSANGDFNLIDRTVDINRSIDRLAVGRLRRYARTCMRPCAAYTKNKASRLRFSSQNFEYQ